MEIINQLKDLNCFEGVFPLDKIKNLKLYNRPSAIVINLDYSNEPGSHWVALFIDEYNQAIYFDSYGYPNFNHYLLEFLYNNHIRNIYFNKYQLQSYNSRACGAFCIIFIKMLCNSFSFREFLNIFSMNKKENDYISRKILV